MKLDELCNRSSQISYEITQRLGSYPPEGYKIRYDVKSIIGIDNRTKQPKYGTSHSAVITLPEGYPGPTGDPMCVMESDTWHPNIKSSGEYKGRICITAKALGAWHSLDMLVLRIGEMLQWKNYLAENRDPFPEDERVAQWVREFAEPQGIVDYRKNIVVDDSELMLPEPGFDEPRPPLPSPGSNIKISKRGSSSNDKAQEAYKSTKRTKIVIRKKN